MGNLLPYDAPAAREPVFTNVARCVVNEIITIQEATQRKGRLRELPKNIHSPNEPYWDFVFETLDATFSDGNSLPLVISSRLVDQNGEKMTQEQRPYLIATAFAGLGIRSVPATAEANARFAGFGYDVGLDSLYDAEQVVGRTFKLVSKVLKNRKGEQLGRELYLPVEAYAPDFVYSGAIRTVTSSQSAVGTNGAGVPVGATVAIVDIAVDAEARARVVNAIAGVEPDDDAVMSVLRAANLGNLSISGSRFLELMADDRLVQSLIDAGFVVNAGGQLQAVEATA